MWTLLTGRIMTNWNLENKDGTYYSLVDQSRPAIIFLTALI